MCFDTHTADLSLVVCIGRKERDRMMILEDVVVGSLSFCVANKSRGALNQLLLVLRE